MNSGLEAQRLGSKTDERILFIIHAGFFVQIHEIGVVCGEVATNDGDGKEITD